MSSPSSSGAATSDDPFRLGWRYVHETTPDGEEITRTVPLTARDLLFPQEGDHVMHLDPHARDMRYLTDSFLAIMNHREGVKVFMDLRVDFNLIGVEPLGPDVIIVDGIDDWEPSQGTLNLAERGRPLLVVEITSPDTRSNDLVTKRGFYQRARVPVYLIVDHRYLVGGHEVRLHVLELRGERYETLVPGEGGIYRLPRLGLGFSVDDEAVWVHDHLGVRIEEMPDVLAENRTLRLDLETGDLRNHELQDQYEEQVDLRQQAQRERNQAETARQLAEAARQQAELLLQREAEARRLADVELKKETEARRLADVELKKETEARRLADVELKKETEARRIADVELKKETEARRLAETATQEAERRLTEMNKAMEERLRLLEEQLRQRNPSES